MKVVAINGSAKKDFGRTATILNRLLDGLRESGAEVDKVNAYGLQLKTCIGCFSCWFKEPGQCFHHDDMDWLSPKLEAADVWILASPVYCWGFSGEMQNFLDRTVSGIEPLFTITGNHTSHPMRNNVERTIALVSTCGLWEMDNFESLQKQVGLICTGMGFRFAGALLRPHSVAMSVGGSLTLGVLNAAREAGLELASTGKFSQQTMDAVSRPLLTRDLYVEMCNQYIQTKMVKKGIIQAKELSF